MKNKQTAVDWLESVLESQCMIKIFAFEDEIYFRKLLNQAKQMEKEQIRSAYVSGFDDGEYLKTYLDLEYYNETYNVKDN